MNRLWRVGVASSALALASTALPAPALAQAPAGRLGRANQKAWLPANFRTGLADCAVLRQGDGFAVAGEGSAVFDESDEADKGADAGGVDFAVAPGAGAVPEVAAHAINTKGTGGSNHRAGAQSCALAPSPRGTLPAERRAAPPNATCSVSGDADAPVVHFAVPLALFDPAGTDTKKKNYVGHVTLIKQRTVAPGGHATDWIKPSYDGTPLRIVARCDAGGIAAKGGQPMRASYDLALAKK